MFTPPRSNLCRAICGLVLLPTWCASLTCFAQSQATPPPAPLVSPATDPTNVADAIAHVKSGDLFAVDLETIVNAKAVNAVPVLEDRFAQTKNADGKGTIASALVRLGDKDGLYWKYLTDSAASAIDADSPDILSVLSQDKSHPPPEMVAWAKAHNTSLGEATEDLLFDLPGRLISLAATGDPRAIPLFRRALLARNPLIQVAGAEGLAQIKDVASVPLIIAACKRGTADHAKALAMFSLIYFDDPDAQQAVDQYYSKKIADEMRKEIAAQKGPFN
jgi:hypothetical protein